MIKLKIPKIFFYEKKKKKEKKFNSILHLIEPCIFFFYFGILNIQLFKEEKKAN